MLQKLKSKFRQNDKIQAIEENKQKPSWFKERMSREEAENILKRKEIGVFIIRESESIKDCFVLSVKVPKFLNSTQVAHYLIVKSKRGFCVRGFQNKEFSDLKSLVTHCSYMRDMLPIQLNLEYYIQEEKKSQDFIYYFSSDSSSSLNSLGTSQSNFSDFSDLENFSPLSVSSSTSTSSLFDEGF